jgi:hypothetical protein
METRRDGRAEQAPPLQTLAELIVAFFFRRAFSAIAFSYERCFFAAGLAEALRPFLFFGLEVTRFPPTRLRSPFVVPDCFAIFRNRSWTVVSEVSSG